MDATERLVLPLLAAGQAQKELWHNEALNLIDLLIGGTIEGAASTPPATPVEGSFYLVSAGATGAWTGRDGTLAAHGPSGWRFVAPVTGTRLIERATGLEWRFDGAGHQVGVAMAAELRVGGAKVVGARAGAIAAPTGGTSIDLEARACLSALLNALRGHGLIET